MGLAKQDKLTAGANITISPDNVISANGGSGPTEVNWSDIVGKPASIVNIDTELANAKLQPTINNSQFQVKRNGALLGGYTTNQPATSSVDIKVPTFTLNGTVLTITNN